MDGLFEPPKAFAERGLTQSEGIRGAAEIAALRYNREVFNVPEFHGDNRNS
jgi:hypothetical protein